MLGLVHSTANLSPYHLHTHGLSTLWGLRRPIAQCQKKLKKCDACAQGLNLKHVFPRIRWMSATSVKVWHASKGGSVTNNHAFKLTDGPDMYLPMPDRSELRK